MAVGGTVSKTIWNKTSKQTFNTKRLHIVHIVLVYVLISKHHGSICDNRITQFLETFSVILSQIEMSSINVLKWKNSIIFYIYMYIIENISVTLTQENCIDI